jgi:hypothetical protein
MGNPTAPMLELKASQQMIMADIKTTRAGQENNDANCDEKKAGLGE